MRRLFGIVLFVAVSFVSFLRAQDLLTSGDVNRIMHQILGEHVNQKELSDRIFRHATAIYIDQFDPERIYLTESEVSPFLHLSKEELKENIESYRQNKFPLFERLDATIDRAIRRAREIRKQFESNEKHALFKPNTERFDEKKNASFARNDAELKRRILNDMRSFIANRNNRFGSPKSDGQEERILQLYETRRREFENRYLYEGEKGDPLPEKERANLFYMHILKALASSLDSHTSFYREGEAYDLRIKLQKEFVGIGLVLKESAEGFTIGRVIEKSPAAENGSIRPEDILLKIDGEFVVDMPFEHAVDKLHGEKGTSVELTLMHPGDTEESKRTYTVRLARALIVLDNDRVDVSSEPFGDGIIGKITLHAFYQGDDLSSEKDVRDAIRSLEKKGKLKGLILDLRENSGGFLSQAVKVAGLFITNGVIVISKYSNGEERFYRDVDSSVSYDGPLVVLTSKMTASAAEIVAAAIRDYGVGLVVGDETTYGKGTVQAQTVTDHNSASYFKVTVGKYYTVSGRTPQKDGVAADIVVPGRHSAERIGEVYLNSVQGDKISPAFEDTLSDVSPDAHSWYLKYYTPTLQHEVDKWRKMIPVLKKNSEYRISKNKNYQYFLTGKTNFEEDEEEPDEDPLENPNYGEDDLQMAEAVNIVKDMIGLSGESGMSENEKKTDPQRM